MERNPLYPTLARAIWLAAGLLLLFHFLDAASTALLFLTLAVILAVALNAPVSWVQARGVPRWAALLLVTLGLVTAAGLLGWLVLPRLASEASALAENLPETAHRLQQRTERFLDENPGLGGNVELPDPADLLPTLQALVTRVGRYTLSAVGFLIFLVLLATLVIFMVARPKPLLQGYLSAFPAHLRDAAARAFAVGSRRVVGWLYGNLIVGAIEGGAAAVFLLVMGVPGALVWGVLTFFAELVPKLGPYLMTVPPVLVALAQDPVTALWVLLFYLAIQEIAGDVIAPRVQSQQMDLHPVSVIVAVLLLGSAFGILGALLATPMAGYVKAYYEEFYLARQPRDPDQEKRVEAMLARDETAVPGTSLQA